MMQYHNILVCVGLMQTVTMACLRCIGYGAWTKIIEDWRCTTL